MIDLHCHLLPGIDDGPPDLDGSLALARAAVDAGIRTTAATPHVDHQFRLDPRSFADHVATLRAALRDAGIPLDVVTGGEVALSRVADLDEAALSAAALGGGPYILLECPLSPVAPGMGPAVDRLLQLGFGVLLAHPERSPGMQRDPDALARLVDEGALAQVTAGALAGDYGQTVRRAALDLVRRDLVHCVASDAHHAVRRGPALLPGIESAARDVPGLEARVAWMTEDVPRAILAGELAPPPPAPLPDPPKRGLRARFRRA